MSYIKIIAEIGINHNGQREEALKLIEAAADAGVWGIKFQYRNLDNAYANGANEIGDEMLISEIKRNFLSPKTIISLVHESHKLGLTAGISFFDVIDIDDFNSEISHFDFFKSPSVELGNIALLNKMMSYLKPLYISLGCHYENDIDFVFSKLKGNNWTALHCVSNYPVSMSNSKLGYLKHMEKKWNRPYGYSSHDEHWETTLIAMSMGASIIERHITFDKLADGLDHTTSSTPDEFKLMQTFSENIDLLMSGDNERSLNQGEMLNLQNLGRSYYAKKDINKGEVLASEQLTFRSPRVGMGMLEASQLLATPIIEDIKKGDVVTRSAFTKREEVSAQAIDFARQSKFAIPVRLHDQSEIERLFPVGGYEFHLSYSEVLSDIDASIYSPENLYSIHLPDYINPTQLMDPFSLDQEQSLQSKNIIQRTVNFADALQQHTGHKVPIVGSFSIVHENIEHFYEQYTELLNQYRLQGISILPQWLPPIAWYFGGSVKLEAVNQPRDIDLIISKNLPICMDVCHLCMGDSVFDFTAIDVITELQHLIEHVHIADARGVDGEGLHFGEGDKKNMAAIEAMMKFDTLKVIEVWQGHLDNGAGFAKALNNLEVLFSGK